MTEQKSKYLVCYDYGQGGLWAFVCAHSVAEITAKYPELLIFPEPPLFYDKSQLDMIAAQFTTDIDDEPTEWLVQLVSERDKDL
ncbi:MAG: hypothetical protein WDM86_05925 [Rhizomicrobium sp.]